MAGACAYICATVQMKCWKCWVEGLGARPRLLATHQPIHKGIVGRTKQQTRPVTNRTIIFAFSRWITIEGSILYPPPWFEPSPSIHLTNSNKFQQFESRLEANPSQWEYHWFPCLPTLEASSFQYALCHYLFFKLILMVYVKVICTPTSSNTRSELAHYSDITKLTFETLKYVGPTTPGGPDVELWGTAEVTDPYLRWIASRVNTK